MLNEHVSSFIFPTIYFFTPGSTIVVTLASRTFKGDIMKIFVSTQIEVGNVVSFIRI